MRGEIHGRRKVLADHPAQPGMGVDCSPCMLGDHDVVLGGARTGEQYIADPDRARRFDQTG